MSNLETRDVLLEALRLSEERYKTLLTNSGEAIFRVDLPEPILSTDDFSTQCQRVQQGVFLECNRPFLDLFDGKPESAFVGEKVGVVFAYFQPLIDEFLKRHFQLSRYEYSFTTPDGKALTIEISCTGVMTNNSLVRFWGAVKDITESKRYLEMLAYQANYDHLTRLPNRDYFRKMVSDSLARRAQQPQALLLFDLDKFKEINDTLGHTYGDKVLKHIAGRIAACLAEGDILSRLGGDEFAVFMSRCDEGQQADSLAKVIENQIKQVIVIEGLQMAVGCSSGIALVPDHGHDVTSLLRCADIAMYESKTRGDGPEFYNNDIDNHSEQRLSLVADLGLAVRHDQLILHYQPKIDLLSNTVSGFEALVRWQHPELGLIYPDKFIHAAEMSNLIKPLTRRVVEKAIAELSEWREKGMVCDMAVNLSARNLMDPGLVPFIQTMLEKYQLPPSCLQLEITESSLMMDPERALQILTELTDMGLEIVVDDFGTGYSSLAYLKRMPVVALKIDRSFIFNMMSDEQDEIIVASTINLAHNLGLNVVAEGVENLETMSRLKELGCDLVQGYYVSRPMSTENVWKWLDQGTYATQDQLVQRSLPPLPPSFQNRFY